MHSSDPAQLLAERATFAAELARAAGARALAYFRKPTTIEIKPDQSPVTKVDMAVERYLRAEIAARFPGDAILGEEFGAEGDGAQRLWIIDPIDGTRSFITGWPIWGTLMAFVEGGHPRLGVIEAPALGERWLGIEGQVTLFTDARNQATPCRASTCRELAAARFYTTSPDYFDPPDHKRIARMITMAGLARFGGDCYGYGLLALGMVDLVAEARLQPYDYMPLVPVIEGAGGRITDWSGARLTLASDGRVLAAATPELHAAALAQLRD